MNTGTLSEVNPIGEEFCYWCAIKGETCAVKSNGSSCIASVEDELLQANNVQRGRGFCYVIWQPKNHTPATWVRWSKKWTSRTASGTAY